MMPKKVQLEMFSELPIDYRRDLQPGKTAIPRQKPSPIARGLSDSGFIAGEKIQRVLDYGCGIGRDVEYYNSIGCQGCGYDQHEPYGFTRQPTGTFDLVTCLFVLNVISTMAGRLLVCEKLLRYVKVGGIILVATRSPVAISREATAKGWIPLNDGFLSSPKKGTFQKGIDQSEIMSLFPPQHVSKVECPVKNTIDAAVCVMRKEAPILT